ncbi:MAG TPA: calcium-binding protein [Actinomycetota bacterium]
MKRIALVSAALLVSALMAPTPATASSGTSLASVFPHEVIHTPYGDAVIYFIEEDILIEVPTSTTNLPVTAFDELDELISIAEDQSMTCDGLKTTKDGTSGDDNMNGTSGADIMHGYAGNDTMDGAGGLDHMCGGRGTDRVRGGAGEDKVIGGVGHDEVRGGPGTDRLVGSSGNDDAYDGDGIDEINLVDDARGDQLYRCLDGDTDRYTTDADEIEVEDVAASSSYC